jgi:hypothetical protein
MTVAGNYFSADYTKLSLASAHISFAGNEIKGITDFSFKEMVDAPAQYANDSVSEGAPKGKHSASGTISMFSASSAALRQVLGGGWSTTFLSVVNSLFEPNGAGLITYTATRVRLGELEFKNGEAGGSGSAIETYSLTIHDPIDWDGIPGIFRGGGTILLPTALPTLSLSF